MNMGDAIYAKAFGDFLRKKRTAKNLSQGGVSELLGHGSGQFLSNIERGKCAIPSGVLRGLVQIYQITEKEIMSFLYSQERAYWLRILKGKK